QSPGRRQCHTEKPTPSPILVCPADKPTPRQATRSLQAVEVVKGLVVPLNAVVLQYGEAHEIERLGQAVIFVVVSAPIRYAFLPRRAHSVAGDQLAAESGRAHGDRGSRSD